MPFGRFRGRPVRELEPGYCLWLLANCDLRPDLEWAARQRILEWLGEAPSTYPPARTELADFTGTLRAVRRKLAAVHHPDRGGSRDFMAGVNVALDEAERALRQ